VAGEYGRALSNQDDFLRIGSDAAPFHIIYMALVLFNVCLDDDVTSIQ
jgi:hypothetical protein